MDNEFILQDRIQKIQQVVLKYDEDNFYLSFSGGRDSDVLSALVDMALPGNKIPRVYADTGIEFKAVRDFVKQKCENDSRFEMIRPTVPIKQMLETYGYPYKSKEHSACLRRYQEHGLEQRGTRVYLGLDVSRKGYKAYRPCPKILRHQFTPEYSLKVSEICCTKLKKEPLNRWQRERDKPYALIGLRRQEEGGRSRAVCLVFIGDKLKNFQPLVAITEEWEQWFINKYDIKLPDVYYSPYNLTRTGCVGCPFKVKLQEELDMYAELLPNERKKAEAIWKPVYDEYRRIGYRLDHEGTDSF